jgi:Domain of unknown function (DUF4394)
MTRFRPMAAAVLAMLIAAIIAAPASAHTDPTIYALSTSNRLLAVSADDPGDVLANVRVSGLRAGESLIGIDIRPLDGKLWAVGRLGTSARMYTIDPTSGLATLVAPLVTPGTTTPLALQGSEFGFDFNPAADALRIVSNTGQNLRALPSARLVMGVQRSVGDTFTDGTLNDAGLTATGVTGAAYINNDNDPATGTTLFDIDSSRGRLVIQNPPNDGTLTVVGAVGSPTTELVGFDIRTVDGMNVAFVSLTDRGGNGTTQARLMMVDLASGATTDLGKIGGPKAVRDIAVAP